MPVPYRMNARVWLTLAGGGAIAFGGRTLLDLGFAHDDWVLLRHMAGAASLRQSMAALIAGASSILFRPAEIPFFALLHAAFGAAPLGWQCASLALHVGLAGAFMGLLARMGAARPTSMAAALLLLAWPAKDSTAFWPIASVCAVSAALTAAALSLHWDFIRLGGSWRRAGSATCLLAALAFYEQSILLFPMWLLVPAQGEEKNRRVAGFFWAAAAAVLCATYQRVLAPWLFSLPHNKEMSVGLGHGIWVYLAALNANAGPKLLLFSVKTAAHTLASQPMLAAAAFGLSLAARFQAGEDEPAPRRLIAWGAAFVFLAYLPLTVSAYSPTPLNHQNRLNLLPAIGVVAMLAGLSGLRRRGGAALACAAALALLVHAGFAAIWAESYRRQLAVRAAVIAGAPKLKDASGLLVRLTERYVQGKAPVFDAHWDITAAVSLWTGLPVGADVVHPETRFEAGKITRPGGRTLDRAGLYFLDMIGGTLTPMSDFHGDPAEPAVRP